VVVGWYDVEPVNAHKKGNHMTAIVLADGTFVWRAYGAVKSELGYASRKVRVTGVVTKGPPDPFVQAVSGPHVKLENITLENGELAPPANALPTPPMVTTMPGFASHAGRWVAVNGVVEALVRGAGAVWADAQVRLSDGGLVVLHDVYFLEWEPFKGKLASAIGRAGFEAADAAFGMTVELHGVGPPCPGVEPRCGMDTKD
jgi:hypothetical protein